MESTMASPTSPPTSLTTIPSPPKPSAKSNIFQSTLLILSCIAACGAIILITLLAIDVFYIPFLSEFSHFIAWIISPFVPLLFPLFLGVFLKICQHKTCPEKKNWMFITGSWVFQHLQRAVTDLIRLIGSWDTEGVCGLSECRGKWVEWILVCYVVAGQIAGWKWDAGYVQWWVDSLVAGHWKKQAEVDEEARKRGEIPTGLDMEKGEDCVEGEKFVEVSFPSAEAEKRMLMAGDQAFVVQG
ncbi:hypothetical protein VTL71DRAFT_4362 [Oculimacula yallundae]|uniref:Uncharacterized protein n=1 Tax=Oculimacula yallundae TaxID=86028 RepID=A0ABR4C1Q2_9HELO